MWHNRKMLCEVFRVLACLWDRDPEFSRSMLTVLPFPRILLCHLPISLAHVHDSDQSRTFVHTRGFILKPFKYYGQVHLRMCSSYPWRRLPVRSIQLLRNHMLIFPKEFMVGNVCIQECSCFLSYVIDLNCELLKVHCLKYHN